MSEQLPVKVGSPQDVMSVEYVATLDDLVKTFPQLPPPDRFPPDVIHCAVTATVQAHIPRGNLIILPTKTETIAYLVFKKFNDNGKTIWIYEGKVKA